MNPPFVKKFDFRGVYGKDITDSDAYFLALAISETFPLKKILLAWDARESSKNLALHFIQALSEKNIEIHIMDNCSIDYLTAGAYAFDYDLSIMFTGSHNPWTWSGLLIHTKNGLSIQNDMVSKIIENYNNLDKNSMNKVDVSLSSYENAAGEVEKVLSERIQKLIPLHKVKKMNILVDTGDGSGSRILSILEKLLPQVTFKRLHERSIYDENSPHVADPSEIKNVQDVLDEVGKNSYDASFIFDSDADRVLAIDEKGNYLNGSLLGSVHIETFLNLGISVKNVGYAVDCGTSIINAVKEFEKNKKEVHASAIPVGRSLVRNTLRQNLELGIENVGHFYAKDFFMTDSGAFSLVTILYWISKNGPLSQVLTKFPDGKRGQFFIKTLDESAVKTLCKNLNEHFQTLQNKEVTVDGIRNEFYQNGKLVTWYTIRHSGYENITKCYFGSLDENDFTVLEDIIKKLAS